VYFEESINVLLDRRIARSYDQRTLNAEHDVIGHLFLANISHGVKPNSRATWRFESLD
jgi:hypothetical protein